jgi:N utilization substance protein B
MSSRRKARETILRALYLSESRGIPVDQAFGEMAETDKEMQLRAGEPDIELLKPFSLGLDPDDRGYAESLAGRIEKKREEFNDLIRPVLKNWDLARVSRIDRIILWIAIAEMQYQIDVPPVVSVNEAVELARKFSSEKSPKFINGVLDTIARNLGIDLKKKGLKP